MAFFTSPIFVEGILPFLLVFVVVFAILQKSEVLGKGKAQIDALVSLALGLLLLGVPAARNFIVNFVPWIAVGVVVLLVFLILYGFVGGKLDGNAKWMKITFGILAGIFILALVIYFSGAWENFAAFNISEDTRSTIFMVMIIGGAIWIVLAATAEKKGDKKKDE
jgi:hypothetical protein